MASPAARHFAKHTGQELPEEDKAPATSAADVSPSDEAKEEKAVAPQRTDSPAKRHFTQVTAKAESQAAADSGHSQTEATQYELMLMQLAEHRRQLKSIQSIEAKIELKKQLVSEYDAYIDGVIASGAGVQDDVIVILMLWHIDAGNYERALNIAEYVLGHGLKTTDQHKRDAATIVAEEIADQANKKGDQLVTLDDLVFAESLTEEHDMPDEVRAKLHKALGIKLHAAELLDSALHHLGRALELNEKSGVKKLIEQIEREKKKAEQQPAGN